MQAARRDDAKRAQREKAAQAEKLKKAEAAAARAAGQAAASAGVAKDGHEVNTALAAAAWLWHRKHFWAAVAPCGHAIVFEATQPPWHNKLHHTALLHRVPVHSHSS